MHRFGLSAGQLRSTAEARCAFSFDAQKGALCNIRRYAAGYLQTADEPTERYPESNWLASLHYALTATVHLSFATAIRHASSVDGS